MRQRPVAFADLARSVRASGVGAVVMASDLLFRRHVSGALTLPALVGMLVDLTRLGRPSLRLDPARTRQIFSRWTPDGVRLLTRACGRVA